MKKLKLAPKIMLLIMLIVVVIMLSIFGYLYLDGHKRDIEQANFASLSIAKENGALVESQLSEGLDVARGLAQALSAFQDYPVEVRRNVTNAILKKLAENNPNLLGTWASFEPNQLDGLDAQFANTEGYDETGRLASYWYWSDGAVVYSVLTNYAGESMGDYYRLAFESGKEQVLEPFTDSTTPVPPSR
jgi:methyl-accepting chemotaxis protein